MFVRAVNNRPLFDTIRKTLRYRPDTDGHTIPHIETEMQCQEDLSNFKHSTDADDRVANIVDVKPIQHNDRESRHNPSLALSIDFIVSRILFVLNHLSTLSGPGP